MSERKLRIVRTLTFVYDVPLSAYLGMDEAAAKAYEEKMPINDALRSVNGELPSRMVVTAGWHSLEDDKSDSSGDNELPSTG